jgi:hypothetical protein
VLLSAVGIVALTGVLMVFALRAVGWARLVPDLLKDVPASEPNPWEAVRRKVIDRSGWYRSFPSTTEMQPVQGEAPPHPVAGDQDPWEEPSEPPVR